MSRFIHSLVIERFTAGARDERGVTAQTYATAATVMGLVQPQNAREHPELNQAGVTLSDYRIYVPYHVDIRDEDRVTHGGATYQIDGIEARNYGSLKHKVANARVVTT